MKACCPSTKALKTKYQKNIEILVLKRTKYIEENSAKGCFPPQPKPIFPFTLSVGSVLKWKDSTFFRSNLLCILI